MDQTKWTTPNKTQIKYEHCMSNSPKLHITPRKQNDMRSKQTMYRKNSGCFTVLPSHITPPSGLTKFIARNPFESDLTSRLHLSMISPTVFSKVARSPQDSPEFAWSVEELALIQPAKINEFPVQQVNYVDPEIEVKAQAAIDQFFDANQIIPSPWDNRRKDNKIDAVLCTPTRPHEDLNSTKDISRSKKDGWCQTVLSLPADLPPHVEDVLKPYFTFTQEQNTDSDEGNSSNSSLRRKLFFNHEDCIDYDDDSSVCSSPVRINGSLMSSSPPQSGMLIDGTPLKQCPRKIQRHGTPLVNSENLSPPNMSPICSTHNEMSFEDMRARSYSVARLDFSMDISVETSVLRNGLPENKLSGTNISLTNTADPIGEVTHLCNDYKCLKTDISIDTETVSKDATLLIDKVRGEVKESDDECDNADRVKLLTDSCKSHAYEHYSVDQMTAHFGSSGQQSICNSAQDTGYQTYSMSSTNNITDNSNASPIRQKMLWGERILMSGDDLQLSDWKENIKNVFCSTPSKHKEIKKNKITGN